jgi:hypothetical protein
LEHLAVEQILDQRDVVQRELADEEDIEAAALARASRMRVIPRR